METSFTYLKSGCLYTLQYSFFEVFLLLLSKKQSKLLTITTKNCAKNTHKKILVTHYTHQKVQKQQLSRRQAFQMVIMQFSGVFSPECITANLYVLIQQLHGKTCIYIHIYIHIHTHYNTWKTGL